MLNSGAQSCGGAAFLEVVETREGLSDLAMAAFGDAYVRDEAKTVAWTLSAGEGRGPCFNRRGTQFLTVASGVALINGVTVGPGDFARIDPGEIVEFASEGGCEIVSHVFPFRQALCDLKYSRRSGRVGALPLVTIVIIAKDIAQYICQAINSCLMQTYETLQIIVVDDGSTDGTLAKARSMASFDNRIEVHSQPVGRNGVRRFGAQCAKGEYCIIIDGDDWLNEDSIEKLMDCVAETESDCVVLGFDHYGDKSRKSWDFVYPSHVAMKHPPLYYSMDEVAALQIAEHNHAIWMYFFSRTLRQNVVDALTDLSLYEDLPFYMAVLQAAKRPFICNYVLYHYRRDRIGQTTGNWFEIPAALKSACLEVSVDQIIGGIPEDAWFLQAILYYKIRKVLDYEWSKSYDSGDNIACGVWEGMSDILSRKLPPSLGQRLIGDHVSKKFAEAHAGVAPIA